jgi:hypothetical protein
MITVTDGYHQLETWLARTPVIGDVHPLLPLALSQTVRIVKGGDDILNEIDDVDITTQEPILILHPNSMLRERFPIFSLNGHPPIDAINRNLHCHLEYAREQLLTTHGVARAIVEDVIVHRYDVVALMLIDGLSYGDVLDWIDNAIPCFVDGPSVTYRLSEDQKNVLASVGFPSIVGSPSVFAQLNEIGYRNALGYSYWAPDSNTISDYLFKQIPTRKVVNFEAIMTELRSVAIKQPTYIQIVREGLDGLAHSKRELSRAEIDGAILAIRQDVERVIHALGRQKRRVCLYLIADHGILWKTDIDWNLLNLAGSKPRYSSAPLEENALGHAVCFERDGQVFYSFHYPYLGSRIRADDSGVHGGLSYQESLVPFAKFEVKQLWNSCLGATSLHRKIPIWTQPGLVLY